jgi:class 3 adenylate cyclase
MSGATPRRERKVVTVVFCDLVGFTARAESMDPSRGRNRLMADSRHDVEKAARLLAQTQRESA